MEENALEIARVLGNTLLLRRMGCLEGTELFDVARRSLRYVPLSAQTLFGHKTERAAELKDRAIEKVVLAPP